VSGDEITFTFRAKNRKLVRRSISNAALATGNRRPCSTSRTVRGSFASSATTSSSR
jgi:hypothetical protein